MQHPNIIKMYEVYDIENHVALILENMDGGNLSKRIQKTPIPEKMAYKVVHVLLEALAYMHSKNILHRDLKPTNIMFKSKFKLQEMDNDPWDRDENVKLIDFGLCCNLLDQSEDSLMHDKSGTVGYLAPEIITKESKSYFYDAKVDVFSVGIVFYEM